MKTVISALSGRIQAYLNCITLKNLEWKEKHLDAIMDFEKLLPSGSGFDAGTKIVLSECKPDRVVLSTQFHHMNDGGYYDGWTEHRIIVTPSFTGTNIKVTGINRNDIKDYIAEIFSEILEREQ